MIMKYGMEKTLLKPFSFERFEKAVNKAKELFDAAHLKSAPSDLHLMIRADYSLMKIMVSEILFIESLDDYIKIHLLGRSPLVTRMTMKSILESLGQISILMIMPFVFKRGMKSIQMGRIFQFPMKSARPQN